MAEHSRRSDAFLTQLAAVLAVNFTVLSAQAQPTVTFDNQSGEIALVKLVGATAQTVSVAVGQRVSVIAEPGTYYIITQYGTDKSTQTYSRGDAFVLEKTATQVSVVTITLHKVVGGNYGSRPSSREEFNGIPDTLPISARDGAPATLPIISSGNQPAEATKRVLTGSTDREFSISGAMVDEGGRPVAKASVFVLGYVSQGGRSSVTVDIGPGGIVNPCATTQEDGRFQIAVSSDFLRKHAEVVIGRLTSSLLLGEEMTVQVVDSDDLERGGVTERRVSDWRDRIGRTTLRGHDRPGKERAWSFDASRTAVCSRCCCPTATSSGPPG